MPVEKALLLAMMAAARDQREKAYAPYSEFRVGAAVLGGSNKVYTGSNVENASFGLTICAERAAIFRAVCEGEREIRAVVIVAGESSKPQSPCGACLQVMQEFAPAREPVIIITGTADGAYDRHTLDDYLPMPFRLEPPVGKQG